MTESLPDASWSFVDVRVPPGALGLIVSKRADNRVVVDGFRPVGADGERGTLERDGRVLVGSVLLGVNEHDFTPASLSFDAIRDVLIATATLDRIVRFSVPPAAIAASASSPSPSPSSSQPNPAVPAVPAVAISTRSFADDYILGRDLGSGTFSVVKQATHRATGATFAIKCIQRNNLSQSDVDALMLEVAILRQLTPHPHIVELFEVYADASNYYLVTEFMAGGELFDRIVEKSFYSERDARELVRTLLTTIASCHAAQIVHRDLKPENLLLANKIDDAAIKVADFGFAKHVITPSANPSGTTTATTAANTLATACGTPGYVAPEILQARPYGKAVDIWSIGVITYILLCGYPPFHDDNQGLLFRKIKAGVFQFDAPYWDAVSDSAKDLITKMLVVDPQKRWTATQLLQHPWMVADATVGSEVQLTGALIELRKFNARRKFKAAVSTVKATIALTKKLTLLGAGSGSGSGTAEEEGGVQVQNGEETKVETHTSVPPPAPVTSILTEH